MWWRKRRFACVESVCGIGAFAEHTRQVPIRARCTVRLKVAVLEAVARAGRAVLEVAASFGVVDGRGSTGVKAWLTARCAPWRGGVQVVAIDPSAAFGNAISDALPHAAVSVDHFHLVQRADQMFTMVRQRVCRDLKGRRGRTIDPSWANRRLLLRGHDTLSEGARARLVKTLGQDDPTQEIGAAWGIKEQLRTLLACGSLADTHQEKMRLGYYVMVADIAQTCRLWEAINA